MVSIPNFPVLGRSRDSLFCDDMATCNFTDLKDLSRRTKEVQICQACMHVEATERTDMYMECKITENRQYPYIIAL